MFHDSLVLIFSPTVSYMGPNNSLLTFSDTSKVFNKYSGLIYNIFVTFHNISVF